MRVMLAVSALALGILPAAAQVSGLQMSAPRPFGILLGDVITLTTRLDVAKPFRLDQAALPKPGPVTYSLDLRSLKVDERAGRDGATRYEIAAEYQTFYAALEAIEQTVPPFSLAVTDGAGKRVEAKSASWTYLTSPLRPIVATAGGGATAFALRPDAAPITKSLRPAEIQTATAAGAALLALLLLAWSRAWPPFHRRPSRPFAQAARAVAKVARSGEEGWRAAALALHRAFDLSAGKRLLGDDLGAFLSARPAFRRHETSIAAFFEASRAAFFGGGRSPLPPDDLTLLAKNLAAAERAA
jgi:mxaA protein